MQTILCDSRITNVTVYARGAMITRSVQIPEALPATPLALQIPKVSALALPGSFRASLEGGREVVSLRTELTLPAQNTPKGPLLERLQAVTREQQRLLAELAQVESLQKLLASLSLQPKLAEDRFRRDSLLHKINGALAASQLTTSLSGSLDEQRFLLKDLIGQNVKVIEALQLEANQASTEQTQGAQVKTRDVFLHLSANGEANQLSLRYTIHAARWWPAYTARILASENRAHFSLDAFVAQASGEDWRDVALSLSTADLILDARLPELASLRFSKAQPAPRRSYRPPPKGLDALFQGYDAAFSGPTSTPAPGAPLPPLNFHPADLRKPGSGGIFSRLGSVIKSNVNDAINKAEDPEKMLNQLILEMNNQLVEAKKKVAVAVADEKRLAKQVELAQVNGKEWEKKHAMAVRAGDDALATEASSRKTEFDHLVAKFQNQHQLQKDAADHLKNALRDLQNKLDEARRKKDLLIARSKRSETQKNIQSTLTGRSDNSAFETFDRMSKKVEQMEAEAEAEADLQLDSGGGGSDDKFAQLESSAGKDDALGALKAKMGLVADRRSSSVARGGARFVSQEVVAQQTEITEAWLDFSLLEMGDPESHQRRGRLQIVTQTSVNVFASLQQLEQVRPPVTVHDPQQSRGQFDATYHAEGTCEVLSNAIPHRVLVKNTTSSTQQEFLTLPKEDPAVYRYLTLTNPFATPLLAGPVEVFIGGAFLTTSEIKAVDKGGKIMLGLGVEERLRVARNARISEANTGLLRGRTEVEHHITIEVSSSLSVEALIKVVDRIPVTDNKDLEVIMIGAAPECTPYDQSDRGEPIRGGLLWNLQVKPNQKAKINLHYKLSLPAKNEVIGGNRRD